MRTGQSAEEIVIRVKAIGGLALCALDLGLLELPGDRADYALGHSILQVEDVLNAAVEMICPQMRAASAVHELRRDAHPLCRFANATFEHISHTQFTTDLLHVDGAALVGEARIACDHEQPADVT